MKSESQIVELINKVEYNNRLDIIENRKPLKCSDRRKNRIAVKVLKWVLEDKGDLR